MDPEILSTARNIEGRWRKTTKPIRSERERMELGPKERGGWWWCLQIAMRKSRMPFKTLEETNSISLRMSITSMPTSNKSAW
jgi:hypothetical protein